MISVEEATALVFSTVSPLPVETVPLPEALSRVLREHLHADRDFPPFDRVTMDGIALSYERVTQGQRRFLIEATHLAGQPATPLQTPNAAIEIMTGAPLPPGTDTVVRYEDLDLAADETGQPVATVRVPPPGPRQYIHGRGTDRRQGDPLIPAGTLLSPAALAVAATVGAHQVIVTRRPRVAVVSTGDELVEINQQPLPHQIRRSNGLMLQAAARQAGATADGFHFPDDPAALRAGLPALLRDYDAVLISGGVSKGKADYLPAALREAGAEQLFHEVRQRPGKPFWFGRHPTGAVVFALPGNPVSTFVSYYRYAHPWLRAIQQAPLPPPAFAVLTEEVFFKPALTYFLLVRLESSPTGQTLAYPEPNHGSGDLASLLLADGVLELPADRDRFAAGEVLPLWRFQ